MKDMNLTIKRKQNLKSLLYFILLPFISYNEMGMTDEILPNQKNSIKHPVANDKNILQINNNFPQLLANNALQSEKFQQYLNKKIEKIESTRKTSKKRNYESRMQ